MANVIGIVIVFGLCAFICYEIFSIVRTIVCKVRERKNQNTVSSTSDKTDDVSDKSNKEV